MGLNRTPLSDPIHMCILKIEFASMSRMAFARSKITCLRSCKYINNKKGVQCDKLGPTSQTSLLEWN